MIGRKEFPSQEPVHDFPKTLADLKLPTLEEAESAVRQGEEMVKQMRTARKGKLLRWDTEMSTIIIESDSSKQLPQ